MPLTQDFKNQCEALLTKWQQFIGEKWQETTWPILVKRTKEGKNKILTDPFFISFKNKSEEEQKWMLKRIEFWYNTKGQGYIEPYAGLYYCIGSVQGATGDSTAGLATDIFQFKNDFLKMIDWEKWTTEKHTDADLEKHKPEDLKPADYDDLKNAIKGVYPNYPTIMEEEKPENIKKYIKGLEDANTKLTTDKGTTETALKNWTDAFGDKKPDEIKTSLDNRPNITQEDYNKLSNNQKPADLPADWKEQLATIPTLTTNQKPADYDAKIKELGEWQANFPNQKPSEAKQQTDQQGNQSTTGNIALNKLLTFYREEITKRTKLFYQDLSLDNNWINEKYGDSEVDYFKLLDKLTIDSEPEKIINAFRVVALIKATEKAQETHNKYKGRLATLSPNLKENNLNKFKKIKKTWDLITDEPEETNNPLYLPIIKGRIMKDSEGQEVDAKIKLNEIINLWQ